ncbi:hypothetical protein NCCP2716_27120 [Sporosarcina sp. NCCP-2716]|nr:hypothetical protein NCCP2716_27120 [Sporosarcina sp. NCCP-2716]
MRDCMDGDDPQVSGRSPGLLLAIFAAAYLLMSIPAMLGVGQVIDWVPEATVFQKVSGTFVSALTDHVALKLTASAVLALLVSWRWKRRARSGIR